MYAAVAKEVPPGWVLMDARVCPCGDEAFVLCRKEDDRREDTEYVTWEVNLRMGGCHHGHYKNDLVRAAQDLLDRFERHSRR